MVPSCSILGYDAFINQHIEDRLAEDSVLLHTNLRIDALKCVCNPLCNVDRAMGIRRK